MPSFSRYLVAVTVLGLLLAATPAAEAIVLDDFSLPDPGHVTFMPDSPSHPNTALVEQNAANVVGGQRDVFIETFGQPQILSAGLIVGYDDDFDLAALQVATFGNPGTSVTLQYDGFDPPGASGAQLFNVRNMTIDLTDDGLDSQLLLKMFSSDGADPAGLDLQITATNPTLGSTTLATPHFIPNEVAPFEYVVPFSDFTTPTPNTFFRQIDSLTFVFNGDGTPNVDYEVDSISTIPEPSVLWLLGGSVLAAAVAVRWRRRRRRA